MRSLLSFLLLLGAVLALVPLGAQSNSLEFNSTKVGSMGAANTDGSPYADAANPAAAAGVQRTTLDASYFLLAGLGDKSGAGHWGNLGIAVPTNAGVFSGSTRVGYSPFSALDWGTFFDVHTTFSKDLYDDLYFGVGLGFQYGTSSTGSDWGLGVDLGFINKLGDVGLMKDFAWGVAFRGIGKGLSTPYATMPANFTPAVSAQFNFAKTNVLTLGTMADISLPTFQNFQSTLGLNVDVYKIFGFQVDWQFDLSRTLKGTARPVPLSFGFTLDIGAATSTKDQQGNDLPFYKNSEYRPSFTVAPLQDGVWAFGIGLNMPVGQTDKNPPKLEYKTPETSYISPNFDGVQDTLEFPLSVTDERFVKSFTFAVKNEKGETVRTIRNKELRPETENLGNLFQRFVRIKKGVATPNPLVWDGNDDKGQLVPDGTYTWTMEAVDDNGNTNTTPAAKVVVDTKTPVLSAAGQADNPSLAFSPSGDRPTLDINLKGSPEDSWTAQVNDARGNPVRHFVFDKSLPPKASWDGKDDAGKVVPDGVYAFQIKTVDRAGNASSADLDNILLINQPTPVGLRADNQAFSPNSDGIKDTVTLSVSSNEQVPVTSWSASLIDPNGSVVRSIKGSKALPRSILLTAKPSKPEALAADTTKAEINLLDKDGKLLPEAAYTLKLDSLYLNGNHPVAESPKLVLDNTKPNATVTIADPILSPNGDSFKDTVSIQQTASSETEWTGTITGTGPDGKAIRTWSWSGTPPTPLVWDGLDDNGKTAADGAYSYSLKSVDEAGNFGESAPAVITLDTRATSVLVGITQTAFSSNKDGVQDTQPITINPKPLDGIDTWTLSILPVGSDLPVYQKTGTGNPPTQIAWDGSTNNGRAQEGNYRALVELVYKKGDRPRSYSPDFALDVTAPTVSVSAPADGNLAFSPDGDGVQDTLTLRQKGSAEDLWIGSIRDSSNKEVRHWNWTGNPTDVTWDGLNQNGRHAADGTYSYEIAATDAAGNKGSAKLATIKVSTVKATLHLNQSTRAFSPTGAGARNDISFEPVAEKTDGILDWKLGVAPLVAGSQAPGAEIWSVSQKGTPTTLPGSIAWKGQTAAGRTAPDGNYIATLTVHYDAGQTPTARSLSFVIDTVAPKATIFAANATFSPDGDGNLDKAPITQSDTTTESQWKGYIFQGDFPANADTPPTLIRSFSWSGQPPKTIEWDGTNSAGNVQPDGIYQYRLVSVDEAGNRGGSNTIQLTIDKRIPTIGIKPDSRAFSPNGDGVKDRIVLATSLSITDGVASWSLDIRQKNSSTVVKMVSASGRPFATIEWDGKAADGKTASDGDYQASFKVTYLKGNQPVILSDSFALDTIAPQATLTPVTLIFSPDGDGLKDNAIINQQSSSEELWTGEIRNANNQVVKTYNWKGQTGTLAWDGTDSNGKVVPDATYSYTLKATDAAGNTGTRRVDNLVVDTRPTPVFLTVSAKGFAPGNSRKEVSTISFRSIVTLKDGIDSWNLSMIGAGGKTVKAFNGTSIVPETFVWDGLSADGKTFAPDGNYTARLTVVYVKGNTPVAESTPFLLDRSAPDIKLSVAPTPFSPDNDGEDDELTIAMNVADPSGIQTWKLDIVDPKGNLFTSFSGVGTPTPRIVWNGTSRSGELVQAAEDYSANLIVTDSLGNTGTATATISVDVLVIRDGDVLRIRVPGINFPPNSDNLNAVDAEKLARNNKTLNRLGEILKKYGSYRITVEGHANSVWPGARYPNPDPDEQRKELEPLSKKRAEAVKSALTSRGVAERRMDTVGIGGARPVVDFNDLKNFWKNIRVEFILHK